MPTLLGAVRNRIFAPDPKDVLFTERGFNVPESQKRSSLEGIGRTFLTGFGHGMTSRDTAEAESMLESIERPLRGFSYEGCAMALAVRDSLRPVRRHWIRDFLEGRGARHVYMVHIGVGWAMARVPRARWRAIMPENELLRWLALDGFGFHQAYFKTDEYVTGHRQDDLPLWEPRAYANRVVDQGIGRALWFVNGADVARVSDCIDRFPVDRQGDLWSGAGLASVYAGEVDVSGLEALAKRAGRHRPDVAQGAAFAAKARLLADLMTPHTELAVKVYCGMPAEEAAAITDEALDGLPSLSGPVPAFEVWRRLIRSRFE